MNKFDKTYLCIGENWRNNIPFGHCGDSHSLGKWLDIIFPGKDTRSFFENDSAKDIVDYILKNAGKRLKEEKTR